MINWLYNLRHKYIIYNIYRLQTIYLIVTFLMNTSKSKNRIISQFDEEQESPIKSSEEYEDLD